MADQDLGDHLEALDTGLEDLRALTSRALPARRDRRRRLGTMQGLGDGMRDRMVARGRAVRRTDRQLARIARQRRRAANRQLLGARLTLMRLSVAGFFRLYWRVMALMLAMAALAWLAVLAWPYVMAGIETLRDWLMPAPVPAPPPATGTTP